MIVAYSSCIWKQTATLLGLIPTVTWDFILWFIYSKNSKVLAKNERSSWNTLCLRWELSFQIFWHFFCRYSDFLRHVVRMFSNILEHFLSHRFWYFLWDLLSYSWGYVLTFSLSQSLWQPYSESFSEMYSGILLGHILTFSRKYWHLPDTDILATGNWSANTEEVYTSQQFEHSCSMHARMYVFICIHIYIYTYMNKYINQ